MFAEENRCTHHQDFLGDPAYRKFSGDGSWNPYHFNVTNACIAKIRKTKTEALSAV
jgi:hypothetical protein